MVSVGWEEGNEGGVEAFVVIEISIIVEVRIGLIDV